MEMQTETAVATDVIATADEGQILNIPVPKAGKGKTVPVALNDLPNEVYMEALFHGLKHMVNSVGGMSKVTKKDIPDDKDRQAEAMKKAEANVEALKEGKFRRANKSKSGEPAAVMTEARRLAKALVKDEMKRKKVKVSLVEASEITRVANLLLENDPSIIEQAKENLKAREAQAAKVTSIGEVVSGIALSPKRVAKEAEDKAKKAKEKEEAKAALSATQAGIVAKAKPTVVPQTRR